MNNQEIKTDMILNLLAEILAEGKSAGSNKYDMNAKIMEIGARIDIDSSQLYKRSEEIAAKKKAA